MIFGLENPIWTVQKSTGVPHIVCYAVNACTGRLKGIFPITCDVVIVFCKDENLEWVYEENNLAEAGSYLVKRSMKEKGFIDDFYDQWKSYYNEYMETCCKIDNMDLSKLNEAGLLELYKHFVNAYELEYSLSMLCDHFGFYAEKTLKGLKDSDILVAPAIKSFAAEEEEDLLKIFCRIKEKNIRAAAKEPEIQKAIDEHCKNYFWIANTYKFPKILDAGYFIGKMESWQREKVDADGRIREIETYQDDIKQKKGNILAQLKIDKTAMAILGLIDTFALMHDRRKKANLMASYHAYLFLAEFSKRRKISLEKMKYIMPNELIEGWLDEKAIARRKDNWLFYYVNGRSGILDDGEADKIHKEIFKPESEPDEIKGVSASPGKVKGHAKIIFHSTELSKMEKGDILVASMTRPDFMIGIHKAAAIVTDEGGITCHAAIISRELKIPCVISTKRATQVFKDGDLVEVDADNGTVRKLK